MSCCSGDGERERERERERREMNENCENVNLEDLDRKR